jgi:hypothetical protein
MERGAPVRQAGGWIDERRRHLVGMARVVPFRALRFASLDAVSRRAIDDIAAVRDQGRRPSAEDPLHVLRLYAAPDPWAALQRWVEAGHVVAEDPALYLIEARPSEPFLRRLPVRFLLGAMESDVPALEQGVDRPEQPPLEPVPVLAADDRHVLRDRLAEAAEQRNPDWESVVGAERIRTWRLDGGTLTQKIRGVVGEARVRPLGRIPERGSFLAAIVPLSEPGLRLVPFHRGLRELSTFSAERFLALVSDYALIEDLELPLDSPEGLEEGRERLAELATRHHGFLLVLPGGEGKLLRLRQGLELSQIRAAPRSPTLRSLDLALLNGLVLRTVLGLRDPEADEHPNVRAVGSIGQLVRAVDEGVFQVGFALNPPPLWELRAVMEAAQDLPPRTMRLSPSPPTGLLFLDPREQGRG